MDSHIVAGAEIHGAALQDVLNHPHLLLIINII